MIRWILCFVLLAFYSLLYSHAEDDGLNPVGTYQLHIVTRTKWYLLDTRTGELFLHPAVNEEIKTHRMKRR